MSTQKSQNSIPNITSRSDLGNHINFVALNNLKVYKSNFIAYTVISLSITVIVVAIISLIHPLLALIGVIGFFLVLVITIFYARAEINKTKQLDVYNEEIFKKFASMNNFGYVFEDSTQRSPGSIFNYGISRKAHHIITGIFRDLPFAFYKYSYVIRRDRSASKYDLQIIELTLPRKVPHMVIDSLAEYAIKRESFLNTPFDRSQKLKLEGDFYKYFDLYASDKFGKSALTKMAPDIIDVLMKYSAKCNVEIIDNKMYFYWPRIATTQQEYINYFNTIGEVLDKIQKKLITSDISAQKSQAIAPGQEAARYPKLKKHKMLNYYLLMLSVFLTIIVFSYFNLYMGMIMILVFTILAFAVLIHTVFADRKKSKLEKELLKK